jgi:hypothetical protein
VPPLDIEAIVHQLRTFSDPACFLNRLPPITAIPDEDYFRDARYQPLREAWAAGRFGRALELQEHTVQLRLAAGNEKFPDFYLSCDGTEYPFELTEALRSGRRRGDEYREYAQRPTALRPYVPITREEGQQAVATAVTEHANSYYAGTPHLLVYANFDCAGMDLRACLALCQQQSNSFASVWVLMGLSVAKLSDSGVFRDAELTAFPITDKA